MSYGGLCVCEMKGGYWILIGAMAAGMLGHGLLWGAFPNERTAWAALFMWVTLGIAHIFIYALQSRSEKTTAKVIVIPAMIRLVVLPGLLLGLAKAFEPHGMTFIGLFVGGVVFFMGLELFLVYRAQAPRSSS
jgi:hypothetical protein